MSKLSNLRLAGWFCVAALFLGFAVVREASAQTVARCGEGWLELVDGYPVLHLAGSHYEMGYQQGALLKESVRSNMHNLLVVKGGETVKVGPLNVKPRTVIDSITAIQKKYVPQKYYDEMEGLAAGAELALRDVVAGNFIPELFHCSGFAIMNSATKDGTLYHGRVLDYAVDWGLQEHAVIVVAEPAGGHPFVNVTYAGFVGSVTGMNAVGVSVGEMGGRGLGHWAGIPMAFLVREVLETAADLDEAIAVFRDNPRTCQYFYVVADGKTNRAVGMEASWDKFMLLQPGEANPLLPTPVKDAALLSAGDRYKELVRRTQAGHGQFDADSARKLMDCPVAMKSNLHNVLFAPQSTKFWVANASKDKKPAADQKYYAFQLSELLKRSPEMTSPELPLLTKTAQAESAATKK
ncbi:MAG: peptidase C45 [Planctomycetaceae bacterium]|nr:peptidase C45 [Planctomycetaceae bacterium]